MAQITSKRVAVSGKRGDINILQRVFACVWCIAALSSCRWCNCST